jgi:hypothetical protein
MDGSRMGETSDVVKGPLLVKSRRGYEPISNPDDEGTPYEPSFSIDISLKMMNRAASTPLQLSGTDTWVAGYLSERQRQRWAARRGCRQDRH